MAEFGFFKPHDPAFGDDEDGSNITLNAAGNLVFQMVPLNGRRMVSAVGPERQDCRVIIESPQVVEFSNRSFRRRASSGEANAPIGEDRFVQTIPAGLQLFFDIKALAAGRTDIVIETLQGVNIATLQVSVKNSRPLKISACRLIDIEFTNPYTDLIIRETVARTIKVFADCANVALIHDSTVHRVECDVGLGNPVVLGRRLTEFDQEESTVFKHIVRKLPAAAKSADIIIIFGWDFEIIHDPMIGMNSGKLCFVDFENSPRSRSLTLEHEIGHALKLGHCQAKTIMNGDGTSNVERFEANEIEILNPNF